jgi:phenylpropionate dioxygenase-like ring-hydroxylating dioxygenase large terminal subunit
MSRIPLPPFPNGWFALAYSDELPAGALKRVHALGREFAVFRGEDGRARVLDAYCPHLGAHLAVGGRVVGNSVRCPFHAWRFDGDSGQCVEIPYAKKIPAKAQVETWRSLERNGLVFVWHHAEHKAPEYEPEVIPELSQPEYALYKKKDWEIKTHPQEVMENGVDFAHFPILHGWKARQIDWEPNGPFYRVKIEVDTGAEQQAATAENATDVNSYNSGPGFLFTRAVGQMTGIAINCLVPVEPERLRLLHVYYHHVRTPREVYTAFFDAYLRDWDLDINIWEHKIHRPRPVLAEGEGAFARYRRWYRQFYSVEVPEISA